MGIKYALDLPKAYQLLSARTSFRREYDLKDWNFYHSGLKP